MGLIKADHNKQLITLTMIALSGCTWIWLNSYKLYNSNIKSQKSTLYVILKAISDFVPGYFKTLGLNQSTWKSYLIKSKK